MAAVGVAVPGSVRETEPWVLAACSGLLAVLVTVLLPAGTDAAAHVYQRELFVAHGLAPWNNLWYEGRYSFVTYSLIYYPLAAALGIRLVAALSAALATLGIGLVLRRTWGRAARWPVRAFAVLAAAFLLTGAFPFALGAAAAMLALYAAQARHWSFFGLCVLAAAASPLAFVFLALTVIAAGVAERPPRTVAIPAVGALGLVGAGLLLLNVLFASSGRSPFPLGSLLEATAFCAALAAISWNVPAARPLRFLGIVLAAACLLSFAVPSALGEGITRFRYVAVPLIVLALALRRSRPAILVVPVVALAALWNVRPLVAAVATGAGDPSGQSAYWQPGIDWLHAHLTPDYRVEAVDTERHWEAAYLPEAGIPIARGWFRQDDFPQNAVLYGRVSAARYREWLRAMAVRYVLLSDARLDYSSHAEARLLRSGRSGLREVWANRHLAIYELPHPRPLVSGTGHARVVTLGYDALVVRLTRGRYRIALRASPYWRASAGCVGRGSDGMLRLSVRRGGLDVLRFSVSVGAMVRALTDAPRACSPAGAPPER